MVITVIVTMLAMMLNKTTLKAMKLTLIIHSQLTITFEIITQFVVFVLSHMAIYSK